MSHGEFVATVPDWARRYYDFEWEITQDVPMHSPPTRPPFDHWIKFVDFPEFTPDAWWVAVDNGVPVGMSSLWPREKEPALASTGLTGVRRSHRRRGLATALKLKAMHWAVDNGFTTIQTDNEENNPMFGLNLSLGFVPAPAELEYRKVLE
jgi:GNAT superfamily N-acetyltransferase